MIYIIIFNCPENRHHRIFTLRLGRIAVCKSYTQVSAQGLWINESGKMTHGQHAAPNAAEVVIHVLKRVFKRGTYQVLTKE
jgi:hypothetical protein